MEISGSLFENTPLTTSAVLFAVAKEKKQVAAIECEVEALTFSATTWTDVMMTWLFCLEAEVQTFLLRHGSGRVDWKREQDIVFRYK